MQLQIRYISKFSVKTIAVETFRDVFKHAQNCKLWSSISLQHITAQVHRPSDFPCMKFEEEKREITWFYTKRSKPKEILYLRVRVWRVLTHGFSSFHVAVKSSMCIVPLATVFCRDYHCHSQQKKGSVESHNGDRKTRGCNICREGWCRSLQISPM